MVKRVGEYLPEFKANSSADGARANAENCQNIDVTPFSNSDISHHSAYLRGLTGAKMRMYQDCIHTERILSVEECDKRLQWAELDRRVGKKTKIKGFSDKSRYKLLATLGQVGRRDPYAMVTLTYRKTENLVSVESAKRHLNLFNIWSTRNYGAAGIWRMELQLNKNPHFHVLMWNDDGWNSEDPMEHVSQTMKRKWCKLTGDLDGDRLQFGLDIQVTNGSARAKSYMVGHTIKKNEQEAYGSGRHWGIFNKSALKIGEPIEELKFTARQLTIYKRTVRKLVKARHGRTLKDSGARNHYLTLDRWTQRSLIDYIVDSY